MKTIANPGTVLKNLLWILLVLVFFGSFTACGEGPGEEPPPESFQRHYPAVIKGSWEPSFRDMQGIVEGEAQALKDIGVNTVSVVPHYNLGSGRPALSESRENYIDQIIKAKRLGFAVFLVPDFVGGEDQSATGPLDEFLAQAESISLEWAQVAEDYMVEFFSPQNEFDWFIRKSYFPGDQYPFDEAAQTANEWHQQVLPKIKAIYTGKTVYKATTSNGDSDAAGYDYLGIDFGHYNRGMEDYREGVRDLYQKTAEAAARSASQWFVAEAWMPYRNYRGTTPGDVILNADGQSMDDLQDEYFSIAIEEYRDFEGALAPSGFVFIAWTMNGMGIKGRPAQDVIGSFFLAD